MGDFFNNIRNFFVNDVAGFFIKASTEFLKIIGSFTTVELCMLIGVFIIGFVTLCLGLIGPRKGSLNIFSRILVGLFLIIIGSIIIALVVGAVYVRVYKPV
jgi:hypothetical protein